jgi:two-component system phosphate regulon sensor histidine kinase PhoR
MSTSRSSRSRGAFLAVAPAALLLLAFAVVGLVDAVAAAILAGALVLAALWYSRACARNRNPSPPRLTEEPAPLLLPCGVLEAIPDPVIVLNGAREILTVNLSARDRLGIGTLGRDLAVSLRHPAVLAAVETLAAGVPSLADEITLPLPVSRTFTLYGSRLPVAGDPRGPRYVLVLQDQTRARRAEQTRADFVANASHELRSPLSSLIGFIETLRGPATDDAVARERFLALMHGEAKRMARLVDDLMSLTRVEINEHVPPRERVDLLDSLDIVVETLLGRAEARRMTITLDHPDTVPPVLGDADQLVQVFHNLVDNAIKYGRPATPVRIIVRQHEPAAGGEMPTVSVAIVDEGDGIPAIHLPRLTERFYRVDAGRSRRMGGTGLGLAIVKHIVNRHRGRLLVESKEGQGSVFTVILPAAAADEAEKRAEKRPDGQRPPADSVTKLSPICHNPEAEPT